MREDELHWLVLIGREILLEERVFGGGEAVAAAVVQDREMCLPIIKYRQSWK